MSDFRSSERAKYKIVPACSSVAPIATSAAPGASAHHGHSACGNMRDEIIQIPNDNAADSTSATIAEIGDSERNHAIPAPTTNCAVTSPMSKPTGLIVLESLGTAIRQMRPCVIRSTFNSARVARYTANPLMHIAQARCQPLRLAALANVRAMSPDTPTDFATSVGLSDDACDAKPNVTTQKNT